MGLVCGALVVGIGLSITLTLLIERCKAFVSFLFIVLVSVNSSK